MNIQVFEKMVVLIAAGLYEKEKGKMPDHYPYSNKLMHGINIFAAQALLYSKDPDIILNNLHEAAFIETYATNPVSKWFSGWNSDFITCVRENSFWNTEALVTCYGAEKYRVTDDCVDLLNSQDDDLLNGMEQKTIYKMLMQMSQKDYAFFRKFLITHPVCSEQELRRTHIEYPDNSEAMSVLNTAYEKIPAGCYRCPVCGWTLTFDGMQAYCCNFSCTCTKLKPDELESISEFGNFRLEHGAMRYIALPGRLELQIQEYAAKQGLQTELWPNKDQFDIGITFQNGAYWAVDAKTHSNPYRLKKEIEDDTNFRRVKADKKFYVIPNELQRERPDYCFICNDELEKAHFDACCITFQELKALIKSSG